MSHVDNLSTTSNPTILGYVGAGIFGFIAQLVFHSLMTNQIVFSLSIVLIYSFIIALIEFYAIEKNCKFCCEINEFWFALELMIKKKLNLV